MNPSVVVDLEGSSSHFPVSELINLLKADDEEASKLKQAEKERQEKNKQKADQTKAKQKAEQLTKLLIKHASHIRDGIPAYAKGGKVLYKAKSSCNASLQVRSLPLSLSLNANR